MVTSGFENPRWGLGANMSNSKLRNESQKSNRHYFSVLSSAVLFCQNTFSYIIYKRSSVTKPSQLQLPGNITLLSSKIVDRTSALRTEQWWNQCNFHGVGWPGYAAPIEAHPPPGALGCAAQLLSPADSDGSDSFQWWPPVLTPIRLGDSGKLALAPHISAWLTQQSGGEGRKGGGGCNCREPVSTFNFCFSYLRFATDLKFFIYNLIFTLLWVY